MQPRLALLTCALGGLMAYPSAALATPAQHSQNFQSAAPHSSSDRGKEQNCPPATLSSPGNLGPHCPAPDLIEIPIIDPAHARKWLDVVQTPNAPDILRFAAGGTLDAYSFDPRDNYGFIRGVEVPIHQDGTRRPFGIRSGSRPEYFTLDRLEFLRGPAALLHASSAPLGVINIVTKSPEFSPSIEAFAASGSFQRKEAGVDITGPIAGETLAARFIALWRDTDAQIDYAGDSRRLIDASLRWLPGPDTTITVAAHFQRDEGGWAGLFLSNILRPNDLPDMEAPYLRFRQNSTAFTAQLQHQAAHNISLSQSMRVEWLTTYPPRRLFIAEDPAVRPCSGLLPNDSLACSQASPGKISRLRIFTSDTRVDGEFGSGQFSHKIVLGADYASLFDNSAGDIGEPPAHPRALPSQLRQRQRQFGLYFQGETRFDDNIALVIGLRHEQARQQGTAGVITKETGTSARIGLMADIGHGLVPYASYAASYIPVTGSNLSGIPFRGQRGRQAEAGIRWRSTAGISLSAAYFDMRNRNRLISNSADPFAVYQVGNMASRGVELEASYSLPENLDITASYSHIPARNRDIGIRPFSIPRHAASIWGNKQFDIGRNLTMQTGLGLRFVTEGFPADANLGDPTYLLADAMLVLQRDAWSFNLNAANLFDRQSYATCLGRGECFAPLPRTFSAALGFRF